MISPGQDSQGQDEEKGFEPRPGSPLTAQGWKQVAPPPFLHLQNEQ
jgi:hypothetical protein